MSDIVERLLTGTPGGDSTYPAIMTEAAKTIESLRAELAKVNMEVDRLTRTNQAKREHRDKLLKAGVKAAARIEQLEAALRTVDDEHGYGLPPETRQMIRAALEEKA